MVTFWCAVFSSRARGMRAFGLMPLLIAPLFALAQSEATSPVGIAHIALRSSDVAREVAFLNNLGFEQAFANTDDKGRVTQAFVKVNDRQYIEVYPMSAEGEASGAIGLMHVCYESANLKALNDHYLASGLKTTSYRTAGAGNILFNLQDPDGRVTEFTQYMPGSRQMNDMGQHLGASRVSDELLGLDMPVRDLKNAQKFYEAVGFNVQKDGAKLRLDLSTNPDVLIELHLARGDDRPQFYFSADDARHAADQLRDAGVNATREKKDVFVRDPDGNMFVLIEVAEKRAHRVIPWKK